MTNPIPEGFHTVTPYLLVKDAANLLDFVKRAFGAVQVKKPFEQPKGTIVNAQVKIGDSVVMFGEAPQEQGPTHSMLYLYVKDADAFFKAAVKAGAVSQHEMKDMFYGDRAGAVKDPAGNVWWIASAKASRPAL
jgi:PhnB protein